MTYMAMRCSRYINGVAMHHGEVSRGMFPAYPVRAITNGVHAVTWTSTPFRALYDRYIPEWRHDNVYLRYAIGIPLEEIREAHTQGKHALITAIKDRTGVQLEEGAPAESAEASRSWAAPGDQAEVESETHPKPAGPADAGAIEEEFDHAPQAEGASDEASALVRSQGEPVGKSQPPAEDQVTQE